MKMLRKIVEGIRKYLLLGYKEFESTEPDITSREEQSILARLMCPIHVQLYGISEYTDFDDYQKLKTKSLIGLMKLIVIMITFGIVLSYGLVMFLIVGFHDDDLTYMVLYATFSMAELLEPFLIFILYTTYSRNLFQLVHMYAKTCVGLSQNIKEFYKELTIKRNAIQKFFQYNMVLSCTYYYLVRSHSFDSDPRFVCCLFTPLLFHFVTDYFPVREIIVILDCIFRAKYVVFMVHISIDTIIFSDLLEYKVNLLMKLMKQTSLSRHQNIEDVRRNFHRIVEYHQEIHETLVLVGDTLGALITPPLLVFVPYIASMLTSIAAEINLGHLDEFSALVILCYFACSSVQQILDIGDVMAEAVYDMDWYEMDNRMTKHFILFLMKVQQPSEIKSLLFHVNKPLFVSLLRTTYSFLMVLLKFT